VGVPGKATHAEETRAEGKRRYARPWEWVEPEVWTERMLEALENGVKGGKWYSLMDKVSSKRTLGLAWERVKRNKGSAGADRQTIAAFEARAERYLGEVSEDLKSGKYRPKPVKRTWIEKPGRKERRPLGVPTVKDRVVQTALKLVMEPIFEARFAERSYGFRPKRGCKDALREVQKQLDSGKVWVVDVDLEGYFDSIPHEALMARVKEEVADRQVLELLQDYLKQGVLDGLETWQPGAGTPQGAVMSPLLANIYLNPLDQAMAKRGWRMVRYADDCAPRTLKEAS
jgi:RNA-directed DNA polymerase